MRHTTIGPDRQPVPLVGAGMGLGGHAVADPRHGAYVAALRRAIDCGMTLVDTAEVYGGGQSEELVAEAIAGRRGEVYVATKVSPAHLRYRDLIRAAEGSLRRLGTDRIDLYQVHWPNPRVPIDETMLALVALVAAGKVRHLGLSNFSHAELAGAVAAVGPGVISAVQVEYNLFDRSAEAGILPFCRAHGITPIAYSPLDQGRLCGGRAGRARLAELAAARGCRPAQLALAWLIRDGDVIAVPSAAQPAHVTENAAAADLRLSDAEARAIDALSATTLVTVPTDRIRVVPDAQDHRPVYRTVDEARANPYGLSPSPLELAADIRAGNFLKAVRARPSADPTSGYAYDLLEGRVRYWAWILAFGHTRDIPVLLRDGE